MANLHYVFIQALFAVPMLAVTLTGLVLIAVRRDRLTPRSRTLGVAGCAVLAAGTLLNSIFYAFLPRVMDRGGIQDVTGFLTVVNILTLLLTCAGLGLVIGAVLAGGTPRPDPMRHFDGWAPASPPDA